MGAADSRIEAEPRAGGPSGAPGWNGGRAPLITVIVPGFNEAAVVERNLGTLCQYLDGLEPEYRWELLFVNDGSTDDTGRIAEAFAKTRPNVRVLHHGVNFGLGQALRFAFNQSRGDYVVTLDADLSYSPEHVGALVEEMRRTGAKLVLASPYMEGGRVSNVPRLRAAMSVFANKFLSLMVKGAVSTLTGMVRAYDGRFIRGLDLRAMSMDINPEIVHKTMLLGGRIVEVPGHLAWHVQTGKGPRRRSSMRVLTHTLAVILAGFLLRPVIFFLIPGFLLLGFAIYVNTWTLLHFFHYYGELTQVDWFLSRASQAVGLAYDAFPHTFIVGGLAAMLSIQLISLGVLSLQSKNYFEELFHLAASTYRRTKEGLPDDGGPEGLR